MKRLLLSSMILVTVLCYADRQHEDFLQAQHLAQNGQYKEALILYDTMIRPGFMIWYNKGICQYQLGNYVDALVAFKRAERYADRSNYKLVGTALAYVAQKANFSISSSWHDTIRISTYYVPLIGIQLLFLLLAFLTVWMFLYKTFSWKMIVLAMMMVTQGVYVVLVWYASTRSQGIVTMTAPGYTGPGKQYQVYTTFPIGSVANIDKKEKSWYKIRSVNKSGWVEETAVTLVEE